MRQDITLTPVHLYLTGDRVCRDTSTHLRSSLWKYIFYLKVTTHSDATDRVPRRFAPVETPTEGPFRVGTSKLFIEPAAVIHRSRDDQDVLSRFAYCLVPYSDQSRKSMLSLVFCVGTFCGFDIRLDSQSMRHDSRIGGRGRGKPFTQDLRGFIPVSKRDTQVDF